MQTEEASEAAVFNDRYMYRLDTTTSIMED